MSQTNHEAESNLLYHNQFSPWQMNAIHINVYTSSMTIHHAVVHPQGQAFRGGGRSEQGAAAGAARGVAGAPHRQHHPDQTLLRTCSVRGRIYFVPRSWFYNQLVASLKAALAAPPKLATEADAANTALQLARLAASQVFPTANAVYASEPQTHIYLHRLHIHILAFFLYI